MTEPTVRFVLGRMPHVPESLRWAKDIRTDTHDCAFVIHNTALDMGAHPITVYTGDAEIPWSRHFDDGLRHDAVPDVLEVLSVQDAGEYLHLLIRFVGIADMHGPFPLVYTGPHPYVRPDVLVGEIDADNK